MTRAASELAALVVADVAPATGVAHGNHDEGIVLPSAKVLGGPTFKYLGEWKSDSGAVLEFENEIDGIKLNGVDIITFDGDGRITHFKVMVRPLKAINLLHRMMGEELMNQSGATSQSQSR